MFSNIKKAIKKIFKSDDNYIRSKVIYNTEKKLMILVSFTEHHFYEIMEFCSSCTTNNIKTKLLQSSYEEKTKDTDGKDITIYYPKYYLLISASVQLYSNILENITQSNDVLLMIKKDIINNVSRENAENFSSKLFEYDILSLNDFKPVIEYNNVLYKDNTYCDDIKYILSQLPSVFTIVDIIDLIDIYIDDTIWNIKSMYLIDNNLRPTLIKFIKTLNEKLQLNVIENILTSPLFLINLDEDDLNGGMSDEDIDDIFKQEYDKYVGIIDDDIEYNELIDERMEDNEE